MVEKMSEEIKAILEINQHVQLVQSMLQEVASKLLQRAAEHDVSKFKPDEFGGIVRIKTAARKYDYGTLGYDEAIERERPTLNLHFERNRHHPEHHPNGVSGMTLVDIIEMVVDWKAANIVRDKGPGWVEATEAHKKRFGLSEEQLYLINLIIKELA